MYRFRAGLFSIAITALFVGAPAGADDGEQTIKRMSDNVKLTVSPE